jgi:hypothetical protein
VNIRYQADADLNYRIVVGLRRREPGIDCLSALEGGVIGLRDPEVLRISAISGRILISHDCGTMTDHFREFSKTEVSPGVIIAPQKLEIGRAIDDLVLIWAASDADEWRGRLRYLPL